MKLLNNNKLVLIIIIVLIVSNILTISSLVVHIAKNKENLSKFKMHRTHIHKHHKSNGQHKKKYRFNEDCPLNQLDMNKEQIEKFAIYREEFKVAADDIRIDLKEKRHALLHELHQEEVDSLKLVQLTKEIGSLHADLKLKTIDLYLNIKKECSPEQQQKLHHIFKGLDR